MRTILGFDHPEGIAVNDGVVLVADVGSHQLLAVDVNNASVRGIVDDAPIGRPDGGQVPFSFCSVAPTRTAVS